MKDTVHDIGCSLKVYRREWLEKIKLYKGMHRFLPILLHMEGARIKQVPVQHKERAYGVSKYNIRESVSVPEVKVEIVSEKYWPIPPKSVMDFVSVRFSVSVDKPAAYVWISVKIPR